MLVDGLLFFLSPQVDGPVLAGSYALVFVDGPDPINRVVVTLQDNLALLLGLPDHHLVVVARAHEIIAIDRIDVQHLGIVAVVGLDDAPLSGLPLLHGQVCADGAQVVGVHPELDPIDGVAMPLQGVDDGVGAHIPQLDFAILAPSGYHLVDRVVAHAQDRALVIEIAIMLGHGNEILLARLPVPADDAAIFGYGQDLAVCYLEGSDALGVALVGDWLAHDHPPKVLLLVDE